MAVHAESPVSLDALRRKIARLEARRDELAARLAEESSPEAEQRAEPAPSRDDVEPGSGPWVLAWKLGNRELRVLTLVALVVVATLFGNTAVRGLAAVLALLVVGGLVWPPTLVMDEQGLAIRGLFARVGYRWTELLDFHASGATRSVEVKTANGWASHVLPLSRSQRDEADACAQGWIAAARAGAEPEQRHRHRKHKKRKRRRDGDHDGVS